MTTRCRTLMLSERCLAGDALVRLASEDPTAIADGRLFVDNRRVELASQPLEAGQLVTWNRARVAAQPPEAEIGLVLECREGIVAAVKPCGWSSEPDRTGNATSLREQLMRRLDVSELHITTRLDVGVSGLVLAATDQASRRHLANVMSSGTCHRHYLAFAGGELPERGTWQGAVLTDSKRKPRSAITHFERVAQSILPRDVSLGYRPKFDRVSVVVLRPDTGHRHQLRIHSSRAGAPLVGDRRYGGPDRYTDDAGRVHALNRIYLHAIGTSIPLPSGTLWSPACPIPEEFLALWLHMGGTPEPLWKMADE
jgi:23S rRNA-/tRNA-specific pseudouridylate synthase